MNDFDPEKVERFNFNPGIGCSHSENGVIVKFEDYDKLLALYREAIQQVDDQRFEERTR